MELAERRTLQWKIGRQHADVVEWNLSSITVIKVDIERFLIIILILIIIITRRLTDLARMKTTELLTPVGTDASTDRQLRSRRRTNNQRLAHTDTHTHTHHLYRPLCFFCNNVLTRNENKEEEEEEYSFIKSLTERNDIQGDCHAGQHYKVDIQCIYMDLYSAMSYTQGTVMHYRSFSRKHNI